MDHPQHDAAALPGGLDPFSPANAQIIGGIFRAVMGRASDDVIVDMCRELIPAHGLEEGARRIAETFLNSREHQRVTRERAIEHEFGRELVAGEVVDVRHVISLGSHCYTSMKLKGMGLKRYSLPFDWIYSSPAMVNHCLLDDFAAFLDRTHYEHVVLDAYGNPSTEHRFYEHQHFDVRHVFPHHDMREESHYDAMCRCVARMRRLLASPEPKLFLMVSYADQLSDRQFRLLHETIRGRTRDAYLLAVRVLPGHRGGGDFGIRPAFRDAHAKLLDFRPTSGLGALAFDNAFDEMVVRFQLQGFNFDLAAQP